MIPETRRLRSRRNDSWPDCMFLSSFVEICLHLVGSPQHCTSTLPGFLAEAQLELEFCPSPTRQGISSVSPMIGPGGGAGGAEEGGAPYRKGRSPLCCTSATLSDVAWDRGAVWRPERGHIATSWIPLEPVSFRSPPVATQRPSFLGAPLPILDWPWERGNALYAVGMLREILSWDGLARSLSFINSR